jgi:uncharacterized repeat protein (TIGR02543 family)
MKQKYFIHVWVVIFLLFTSGANVFAQSKRDSKTEVAVVNGYRIVKGERPPIDLSKVNAESYEKGKISVKFTPEMERSISQMLIQPKGGNDVVQLGNINIDKLNKEFGAVQYKSMLYGLYEMSAKSAQHKERHKAWGFHLWFEISIDADADIKQAVEKFAALKEVEIVEPVYKKRLIGNVNEEPKAEDTNIKTDKWTPNDPRYAEQWHYHNTGQQSGTVDKDIDLPEAWDIETGNSDVIIAIVDGGIQTNHPDLSANIWSGVGYNFVTNTPTIEPHDHGTHVAGTVAGVNNNGVGIAGVAGGTGSGDGVRLMSCQVFTGSSSGGFDQAPIFAADNGAAISQNSWGYTSVGVYDQATLDAIDYFNTNGGGTVLSEGITIFAAGNDGTTGDWYPGCYAGVMGVAATNNQDVKSWYSNYGAWVDISAPGGETNSVNQRGVLSTTTGNTYSFYQGTSMACPHVSGVAALIVSYASRNGLILSAQDVWDLLVDNVDNHYPLNSSYSNQLGSGRLNAYAALLATEDYISGVLNPQTFNANAVSTSQIDLSWTKNADSNNVMLVWSADGSFGIPTTYAGYSVGEEIDGGGIVLYRGPNLSYSHTNLSPSTQYYYKAFSYNAYNEYSSGKQVSASTLCGSVASFPFTEGFEEGMLPNCWSFDGTPWSFANGGHNSNPSAAHSGSFNALFYNGSFTADVSRLITPQFDFTGYTEATLTFWHAQVLWPNDQDELRVYYKNSASGSWQLLAEYTSNIAAWTQREIALPNLTDDYYIAFEATGQYGYGVVIDDINISATELLEHTLTLNLVGSGSVEVDGVPYTEPITVENGSSLSLEAVANSGYQFDGWSGDLNSANPQEVVAMDSDKTITATFSEIPATEYTLTLNIDGNGTIAVNGDEYTAPLAFAEGTEVELRAIADMGWQFDGYDGDFSSTNELVTVTMNGNMSISATFSEIPVYTITVSKVGEGTTTPAEGTHDYLEGATVSFYASPATGYEFEKWVIGGTEYFTQSVEHPVSTSIEAVAHFVETVQVQHTLAVSVVGNGTTNPPAGNHLFNEGAEASLTATPAEGWMFDKWVVNGSDVLDNPATVQINDDVTAVAHFTEIPQYTLTVTLVGNGSVDVDAITYTEELTFLEGAEVDLRAVADVNWNFEGWSGDILNDNDFVTLIMDDNKSVIATFTEDEQYTLTLTIEGDGTVEVDGVLYTEAITVYQGTELSLSALANEGSQFDGWSIDLVSANTNEIIVMDGNKSVAATFSPIAPTEYTLTISLVGNGLVEVDSQPYTEAITVEEGTTLNLRAIADDGWLFSDWSGDLVSSDEYVSVVMDSNKDIEVTFTEIPQYTLTVQIEGSGSVTVDGDAYTGPITAVQGTEFSLNAIANEGWQFDGWSNGIVSVNEAETIALNSNITVVATFTEIPVVEYTLTISVVGSGSVDVNTETYSTPIVVEEGTELELRALSDIGWVFEGWTGDIDLTDEQVALTMDADKNITATFTQVPEYTLTINIEGNGTVEVDGNVYENPITYYEGEDVALNALANEGWQFDGWSGDITSISATETLSIIANTTLTATFTEVTSVANGELANITLYPNPFSNAITISNANRVSRVTVTNILGQVVIDKKISSIDEEVVSTQSLTKGIYLLTIHGTQGERIVRRMVKE